MGNIANKVAITIIIFLLCSLLIVATLLKAGNLAEAKMWIQLISITIITLALIFEPKLIKINKHLLLLISSYFILSLLYLLPITYEIWKNLPGRWIYIPVGDLLEYNEKDIFSLSIIKWESVKFILGLIPPIVVFIIIKNLKKNQLKVIFLVFFITVIYQDLLGLVQYFLDASQFSKSIARILNFIEAGGVGHQGEAHGTYLNRDHYSSFLAMSISLIFSFTVIHIRNFLIDKERFVYVLLLVFLLLLTITSLAIARSRAGISLTIISFFINLIIFYKLLGKEGHPKKWLLLTPISGVLLIFLIPTTHIINRFIGLDPAEDGRIEIFSNTIIAIKHFFPIGSGPGTFDEIYRNFQPIDQLNYINHAHNDYLELLMETGVVGIYVIFSFFIIYFLYTYKLFQQIKNKVTDYSYIRVASFVATLIFLFHALVDFNFHTPANAIYFSLFLGIFVNKNLEG